MTNIKLLRKSDASTTQSTNQAYTVDFERFNKEVTIASTGLANMVEGYNVFVSTSGSLAGSYTITSSQGTYRTLNSDLQSKRNRK